MAIYTYVMYSSSSWICARLKNYLIQDKTGRCRLRLAECTGKNSIKNTKAKKECNVQSKFTREISLWPIRKMKCMKNYAIKVNKTYDLFIWIFVFLFLFNMYVKSLKWSKIFVIEDEREEVTLKCMTNTYVQCTLKLDFYNIQFEIHRKSPATYKT